MAQINIAVLVSSLRRESLNRKLATALARLAPSEVTFKQLEIGDLPLLLFVQVGDVVGVGCPSAAASAARPATPSRCFLNRIA